VLRGCILIELSLRGRIDFSKDTRRRALADRIVEVVDKTVGAGPAAAAAGVALGVRYQRRAAAGGRRGKAAVQPTGDVILDEALKIIATDEQTVSSWIDLLSGAAAPPEQPRGLGARARAR